MEKTIRVLACNPYSLFIEGLKAIFRGEPSIEVVGEATEAKEAIELVRKVNPDVVLMDIAMPDMSGFEATKRIKEISANTRVLIVTMHDDETLISRCLEAGASGYLLRDAGTSELTKAISAVESGKDYRNPRAA